jgi:hypothetical protein
LRKNGTAAACQDQTNIIKKLKLKKGYEDVWLL